MDRSSVPALPRRGMIRLWFAAWLLASVAACGGGGGDPGSAAPIPAGVVIGQVVKGLTQGSTVSLYSLSDSGQRTLLASAVSNASGEYRLTHSLQPGQVYLLEATGGQYVNEITGLTEALSAPLRGVFVASGNESRLALSALSETVVLDLERSGGPNSWSVGAVAQASARAASAFDLTSVLQRQFVDMTTSAQGSAPNLGEDDVSLSLQAGIFAGFWQELRLRNPGTTLAQALQGFHAISLQTDPDRALVGAWLAGLIRFVERAPVLANSRSLIYQGAGLPADASSAVFDGAQNSGQAIAAVPNRTFRLLQTPAFGNVAPPDTETFFDSRGALIAFKAETTGLRHVGSASVSEVYGDADLAIGRWNKGFEFASGVTYDAAANWFDTDGLNMQALSTDYVYAAGRTATGLPACGTAIMSPRAQTKAMRPANSGRTYVLDAASRVAFHHANGQTLVGYTIILRDDLGGAFTLSTPYGAHEAPWRGQAMINFQEFANTGIQYLPSGESVQLHGLLVGEGGTKVALRITTRNGSGATARIAVAFAQDGSTSPCSPTSYAAGTVSPIPTTGDYHVSTADTVFMRFEAGMQFLGNGTPLLSFFSGIGPTTGVEKAGNDIAGIGMLVPPYAALGGIPKTYPQPYVYLKLQPTPVVSSVQSGTLTYQLVASTPQVVLNHLGLIATVPAITTATLTIDLDHYQGEFSPSFGTCHLTVNGQQFAPDAGTFNKSSGVCADAGGGGSFYVGGISGGDHRHAVLHYEYLVFGEGGGSGLLFERVP